MGNRAGGILCGAPSSFIAFFDLAVGHVLGQKLRKNGLTAFRGFEKGGLAGLRGTAGQKQHGSRQMGILAVLVVYERRRGESLPPGPTSWWFCGPAHWQGARGLRKAPQGSGDVRGPARTELGGGVGNLDGTRTVFFRATPFLRSP